MAIATIAIKPTLPQSRLVAAQRATGAIIDALVTALVLLTIDRQGLLDLSIVVLGALGGTIRNVNYTLYTAAIAAVVLIANDLSHPADLTEEAERIVFTLVGVGIATKVQERVPVSPCPDLKLTECPIGMTVYGRDMDQAQQNIQRRVPSGRVVPRERTATLGGPFRCRVAVSAFIRSG
jgi:hypothetical protein